MSGRFRTRRAQGKEDGYALVLIMFFLALLVISTVALAPNLRTNDRREKEEDMVWRGKQYVRGIRLYYQKTHRFPTQLEDLYKPKTGIRFMRQAYKDPMNTVDGSWRLIYVGPNGQLIGSLKAIKPNLNLNGQAGSPVGNSPSSSSSIFSSSGSTFSTGSSVGAQNSTINTGNAAPGTAAPTNVDLDNPANPNDPSAQQLPADGTLGTGTIIGGNIIGVGSKINKKSFMWLDKAKNYRQFEFVWDPSVDSVSGQRLGQIPQNSSPSGNAVNSVNPLPSQNMGQNPTPDPGANPPLQAPPNQP